MAGAVIRVQGASAMGARTQAPIPAYFGNRDLLVTGSGFTGATGVRLGAVPALSFKVLGDNLILATVPAMGEGPWTCSFTTPLGGEGSTSGIGPSSDAGPDQDV